MIKAFLVIMTNYITTQQAVEVIKEGKVIGENFLQLKKNQEN